MNDETEKYLLKRVEELEDRLFDTESKLNQEKALNKAISEGIHNKNIECNTYSDIIDELRHQVRNGIIHGFDGRYAIVISPFLAEKVFDILGIDPKKEDRTVNENDKNSKNA